jgi:hypothetical protein
MKIEIKDSDIAIVEALRDCLLDSGAAKKDDLVIKRSFYLTNRMYEIHKKPTTSPNILEEANNIIFNRGEEKERQYGPIDESLQDTAVVASIVSNTDINIDMVYAVLVALKMSRLRHNKKHDTFLDGIGYLAAFEDYVNNKK